MCYHNLTQHSGCGHIGEAHTEPYTLCTDALVRLQELRGHKNTNTTNGNGNDNDLTSPPTSPLLNTANNQNFTFRPPHKRSSSSRRFFSLSNTLSRSSTTASISSRRSSSYPAPGATTPSRTSTSSSLVSASDKLPTITLNLPQHLLTAARCSPDALTPRTQVSNDMQVCKICAKWLREMRWMLERWDATGSVRGTSAFERFLRVQGDKEVGVDLEGDVTVKVGEVARQAVIMGAEEA